MKVYLNNGSQETELGESLNSFSISYGLDEPSSGELKFVGNGDVGKAVDGMFSKGGDGLRFVTFDFGSTKRFFLAEKVLRGNDRKTKVYCTVILADPLSVISDLPLTFQVLDSTFSGFKVSCGGFAFTIDMKMNGQPLKMFNGDEGHVMGRCLAGRITVREYIDSIASELGCFAKVDCTGVSGDSVKITVDFLSDFKNGVSENINSGVLRILHRKSVDGVYGKCMVRTMNLIDRKDGECCEVTAEYKEKKSISSSCFYMFKMQSHANVEEGKKDSSFYKQPVCEKIAKAFLEKSGCESEVLEADLFVNGDLLEKGKFELGNKFTYRDYSDYVLRSVTMSRGLENADSLTLTAKMFKA